MPWWDGDSSWKWDYSTQDWVRSGSGSPSQAGGGSRLWTCTVCKSTNHGPKACTVCGVKRSYAQVAAASVSPSGQQTTTTPTTAPPAKSSTRAQLDQIASTLEERLKSLPAVRAEPSTLVVCDTEEAVDKPTLAKKLKRYEGVLAL